MYVIVTGASKGIGLAIADKFASAGNEVLICSRNREVLEEAAISLQRKYPHAVIRYHSADMSVREHVQAFAQWSLQYGTPDIVVNNAGVYLPGNIHDEPEGQLEKMMQTNLFSAYHLTRALLPGMMLRRSGSIVNICSIASLYAYEGGGGYSISKFAMHGFNQNLRHEMKKHGIRVIGVYPGAVMTDSWGGFDNSSGRIMEASDVASMVWAATQLSVQAVVEDIVMRPQLGDL